MEDIQNQNIPKGTMRVKISALNDPGLGNAHREDLLKGMREHLEENGTVCIVFANGSEECFTNIDELNSFLKNRKII